MSNINNQDHLEEVRKVYYLNPQQGWIEQETDDAKYRLTASSRTTVFTKIENELEVRNPRGGWDEVTADMETNMPATERGYVFVLKPRQSPEGSFIEITSKRFVDEEMVTSLFDSFPLFDRDLKPIVNPALAVDTICIPSNYLDAFKERANARAMKLNEGQADLHTMYAMVTQIISIREEMERLCAISRQTLNNLAQNNNATEIPALSDRARQAHNMLDQAASIVEKIKTEKLTLDSNPGQLEHKAYGSTYLNNAESQLQEIDKLYREHKSYEIQAVSRMESDLSRSLPSTDFPASSRRQLMLHVVEYYTEMGFDCLLSDDGMTIHLEDGVIELSDKPKIILHQKTNVDNSLENQSADRKQREL